MLLQSPYKHLFSIAIISASGAEGYNISSSNIEFNYYIVQVMKYVRHFEIEKT